MCLYHNLHSCSCRCSWGGSPLQAPPAVETAQCMGVGATGLPPCVPQDTAWTFQPFCYPLSISFSLPSWLPDTEKQNHHCHCHYCAVLALSAHHWDFSVSLLALTQVSGMYRWDISASQGNEGGVLMGVKHNVTHKKIIFVCYLLWKLFNSWQLSWN